MGQTGIPLAEVARNWLRRENKKLYRDFNFERKEAEWELVGELLCQCPFQAAFIWQHHITWYAAELDKTEFLRLRVIDGPADSSWRKLSPDNTIRGAAKRIIESELPDTFEDIDVAHIKRLADSFETTTHEERLTLFQPDPGEASIVVDGNHYSTAKAIHQIRSGAYDPQPVYLGVRQDCTIHDDGYS
ncbi:hypothetical protein ACFQS4_10370 [Saliphagus sp. GCM10025317]